MSENDELYEAAKKAVEQLFSDTSVSQSVTRERLGELIDEIRVMIESME